MRWFGPLLIGAILLATVPTAILTTGSSKTEAIDPLSTTFSPTLAAPGGVVINPGTGVFHYPWGNPSIEAWPWVAGRAGGPFWKHLEPSEGYFNWSVMENWLANQPPGRKTWLRLDASMRANETLTPEWVFQAGARWVPFVVNGSVKIPVYWDPVFKAKWEAAIAALAARYDGDPRLAGVEVNGQGHYGEMVPEWERIFNGDQQTWINAGYSFDGWVAHQKWSIDMFMKYFKKTPVAIQVVNDGALWGASPARPVLDYAVQTYGMRVYPKWSGLGLNMRGMDSMFLNYVPYTDVIYEENLPFTGSADQYGQVVNNAIGARASMAYIYWSEFDPNQSNGIDYRPQLQRMAQYLGPQLFISSAQLPSTASAGGSIPLTIRWGNRGNLPLRAAQRIGEKDVPASGVAFVDLVAADGSTAFHHEYQPVVPTTQWHSNSIVDDLVSLPLPATLAAGTYDVRVGIYNPRPYAGGARLKLLNSSTNDGSDRYQVGQMQVASSGTPGTVAPPPATPTPTPTPTPIPTSVPVSGGNLAQGRPAFASTIENFDLTAAHAVDGNAGTRWSSVNADPQWMYVDLGARYNISQVVLKWETAYGRDYQIQVSDDANNWTTVYNRTGGTGGTETLNVSGAGRYVRMYGTGRGAPWWGYSLWEFEVYGSPTGSPAPSTPTPTVAPPAPTAAPPAATPTSTPIPTGSLNGSIIVDPSRVVRTINPLWLNGENVDQREWAYASGNYGDDPASYKFGVVRIWDVPFWGGTSAQVDEAVKRVKSAGLEPMVIIMNPKLNDPGWAASRVQHFKSIGYPVKYFEFGNENDINDSSTPDGPFDGNAVGYSDAFNAAYDAMKAVDPSIKVGGPAVSGLGGFFQTFLQRSGSRTDFVSYHNYAPWGDQDGQYGFRPLAQYARGVMNQYVTANQYRGKNEVFLFLGEWDHASQNAPNAVYNLSALYWQVKGGLDMVTRYQHNDYWREEFNTPWGYSLYNSDGSRESAFYYHQIARDYLGDQVLESSSDDGQILALGTRRSGTGDVNLIVTNMKDQTVSKSVAIGGVASNALVRVVLWNDQVYPPREVNQMALAGNSLTYSIPAKSAVVFSVGGGGSPVTSSPTPTPIATTTATPPAATPTPIPTAGTVSGGNIARGRPAFASSVENSDLTAAHAVDGNTGTRWSSVNADPQWMHVDLGAKYNISQVVLKWETAYGRDYQIQVSDDARNWTTIYNRTGGTGGTETLNVSGAGRYVRMYGTVRGTPWWGYSLWEFEVYGTPAGSTASATPTPTSPPPTAVPPSPTPTALPTSVVPAPTPTSAVPAPTPKPAVTVVSTPTATQPPAPTGNLAQGRPAAASTIEGAGFEPTKAVDRNLGTRWASVNTDPQWMHVDLGAKYNISQVVLKWETAYGRDYQIQVSDDAKNWTTIYNRTGGTGGTETLNVSGAGRYVRVFGTVRGTPWWGYSLFEFEVYGK